jgi:short-subunit dehydrogenase
MEPWQNIGVNYMSKVVLITGASSGFGKATAMRLKREGYTVYGASRNTTKLEDLSQKGINVFPLDVTDDESVKSCVKAVIKKEGRLDVLINNAGYGGYGMMEVVSMEEAHHQFEVNIFGPARMVKAVLPQMRRQKSGTIINLSSVAGQVSCPMVGWYGASKRALEGWTDALRAEVKGFGIKVVIIEPGAMNTGFVDVAMKQVATVNHPDVYRNNVEGFIKGIQNSYKKAPGPRAVVDAIVIATKSRKPRTRYAVGMDSKSGILMTRLLSDSTMDNLMRRMYNMR